MDGSLLAWGRGVKPGKLAQPASVFDIAPTILYAFDLPVESDLDGHALTDLFTFQHQLRMRDSMTGAVWTEGQSSDRVRRKLDRLLGEGTH
jgi:arylsulfatase A-like enzyme